MLSSPISGRFDASHSRSTIQRELRRKFARNLSQIPYQLQRLQQRTDDERRLPSIGSNAHIKRYLSGIRAQKNLIQVHAREVRGWLVVDTYCPYNVLK
jgi:hypothetical protein